MKLAPKRFRAVTLAAVLALVALTGTAFAVTSVTLPGDFQSELGCAGDWMADGACTHLTYDSGLDKWVGTFSIPAGSWQYKIAIDDAWTENYGVGGVSGGANYGLNLAVQTTVTFTYDATTHIVTNDAAFIAPGSVTLAGSFQSELGCPGDWMPDGACTHLTPAGSNPWTGTFQIPAGSYEYKVAINDSWTENYGAGGIPSGANMALILAQDSPVAFSYDPVTHVVTTSAGQIVVAAGSFQSELGCAGDWMPDCLNSQLTPLGPVYRLVTTALPSGDYEFKITIGQSWNENYGQGGAPGGANLAFTVPPGGAEVTITYDSSTHVPTVTVNASTAVHRATWGQLKLLYR